MISVQKKILAMAKGSEERGMREIKEDMDEDELENGAYVCGYTIFKSIYRLEARRTKRLGLSEHVLLLTLRVVRNTQKNEAMDKANTTKEFYKLKDIVQNVLRTGDVMSQYSDNQIIVLLPTCSFENTKLVAERIEKRFKEIVSRKVMITIAIDEVSGLNICKSQEVFNV